MIDYNYTIKKKLEGGKMSELSFMYWIKVFYNNGVGTSGAHSIEDAERRFNIDIRNYTFVLCCGRERFTKFDFCCI